MPVAPAAESSALDIAIAFVQSNPKIVLGVIVALVVLVCYLYVCCYGFSVGTLINIAPANRDTAAVKATPPPPAAKESDAEMNKLIDAINTA